MIVKDLEYNISKWGIISGLIGYALSFYSVYFFHLMVLIFLIYIFLISGKINLRIIKVVRPVIIFFIFSAFTLIWVRNFEVGILNLFYIACGCFAVIFTVLATSDSFKLREIYKVLILISMINFTIGFCESLGFFRFPISPFSPYAPYFGIKVSDLNEFSAFQLESILSKPTGFNGNPNTFGFVFILLFPFLFFYNKYLRIVSILFILFFNYYVQSRGIFLATILFFLMYFLINFGKKFIYFILIVLFFLLALPFLNYDFGSLRISNSFESLSTGVDNIFNKNINLYSSSTDIRSSIYTLGIIGLLDAPILGLGLGGIQSILIEMNSPIQAFHFYFLEVLVDYGIAFYLLFIGYYGFLIFKLFKISKKNINNSVKSIVLAVFYSLIIMPVASITPSSIVYNLTAWIIIGLALSIIYLDKEGKLHDN